VGEKGSAFPADAPHDILEEGDMRKLAAVGPLALGIAFSWTVTMNACGGRVANEAAPAPDAQTALEAGAFEAGTLDTGAVSTGILDGPAGSDVLEASPDEGTADALEAKVATPTFDPPAGTYLRFESVRITTTPSNATIYYTVDDTNPNVASFMYSGPLAIVQTTTLRAYATAPGYQDSDIAAASFVIIIIGGPLTGPPIPSPPASTENNDFSVSLASETPGATICFTLDGSLPLEQSCVSQGTAQTYDPTAEIPIDGSVTNPSTGQATVSALSCSRGNDDGFMIPQTYTLQVATPDISPPSGPIAVGATVSWTSATTTGVTFHYTTDGTAATCASASTGTDFVTTGVESSVSVVGCKPGYESSVTGSASYT
jgi:hypothetical protein